MMSILRAAALTPILVGCAEPDDAIRRTPPPGLAAAPVISLTPSVDRNGDGVPWARAGAELTVALDIDAPEGLDLGSTTVTFTGVPLSHRGDGVWGRTLDGDEGDGEKVLDLVLVDDLGQQVRIAGGDDTALRVGFDFTGPRADCILSPTTTHDGTTTQLLLRATEPLAPGLVARADHPDVLLGEPTVDSRDATWPISFPSAVDVPAYTLTATGSDRVGNPQEGASLCTEPPVGLHKGIGPALDGTDIGLTVDPSLPGPGAARATTGAAITVTLPLEDAVDPDRSFVSLSGVALSSTDGETWTGVLGTPGDGLKTLFASLVDPYDNRLDVSAPEVGVIVDTTPPTVASAVLSRAPAFSPSDDGEGTLSVGPDDPLTGESVAVTLRVITVEAMADDPVLSVNGPHALSFQLTERTDRIAVWTLAEVPTDGAGTYGFTVQTEDDLGNRSGAVPLDVTLEIDVTPPPEPDVHTPDTIVYARTPWGSQATGGVPRFAVTGGPGAADSDATVVLLDALGRVIDSTRVDSDGSFPPLVGSSDLADVSVAVVDDAGNRSAALRVRDVAWTATLGGKVAGQDDANPHRFLESTRDSPTRLGEVRTTVERPAPVATTTAGGHGWTRLGPLATDEPSPRERSAAAWDAADGSLVLFGGLADVALSDTWIRQDGAWSSAQADVSPPARALHTMVYDPQRERVVLFGGAAGNTKPFGDTWVWDGTAWTEQFPTTSPPARAFHAMVYDGTADQIVLTGGQGEDFASLSDTWVLKDDTWRSLATSVGGLPGQTQLGWDPVRDKVVMTTGASDGTGATWLLDGDQWVEVPGSNTAARQDATITWDPVREQLIRVGGEHEVFSPGPPVGTEWARSDAVWAFDGAAWQDITPPFATRPVSRHVSWYEPAEDALFVFGGGEACADFGCAFGTDADPGTWRLYPEGWYVVSPGDGPSARYAASGAWEPIDNTLVLHAGLQRGGVRRLDETWVWTRGRWTQMPNTEPRPPAVAFATMAHDPLEDALVLYGGSAEGGGLDDRTWVWSFPSWQLTEDAIDPGLEGAAMAPDGNTQQLMLFGGRRSGTALDQTFTRSKDGWEAVLPDAVPPARFGHGMAWDPLRAEVVVHGGTDDAGNALNDTWVWDGTLYKERLPTTVPPAEGHVALAWFKSLGALARVGQVGEAIDPLDVWIWDGADWSLLDIDPSSDSPGARREVVAQVVCAAKAPPAAAKKPAPAPRARKRP